MKKIRKQVLSAALALSMGFTLIPQNFIMTAFAGNEAEGEIAMKTDGVSKSYLGTGDDPSFRTDMTDDAIQLGYYGTGLSYGSYQMSNGDLLFYHVKMGDQVAEADMDYSVFDRRAMYCVDKHTGDTARNVFNNGFSKGILKFSGDGNLVNAVTGEDASPVHAADQKFTTAFLIACLGYRSDYSNITDSEGYMAFGQSEVYQDGINIRALLWALATEDMGLTGEWKTDFARYKSEAKHDLGKTGAATDPVAIICGCENSADEMFYKCWLAARMNSGVEFEDGAMTKAPILEKTNEDGSRTQVFQFDKDLVQAGLKDMLTVTVDGGTYTWDDANGTLVVTCPEGSEVSGTVTATGLSWDGDTSRFSIPNFATADIGRFYYASIDENKVSEDDATIGDVRFTESQNYMSVVFNDAYTISFGVPKPNGTKRYLHEETWEASYNVRLAKFDSETGKPLEGSHFDILEKFDDSQLDNTNLEYDFSDVTGDADAGGGLQATDWGVDDIESNWTGDTGVIVTDDNYRNWGNDKGSQFEKWDDPENDPCTKDDEKTGDDGFLQTNGSGSADIAHNDTRNYTYKKGYKKGFRCYKMRLQELSW